ncbi:glycosyltransferase [Piscinibacter sp.]|uniref:glycosyltransferase n=1 Tax=Piscinibacter sp. TaxID=1903157 RepID=UPI002C49908D|nr:glycosyltransferase [Albitalea sp.]HUG24362.1 glycosyltransferase [Albitalea sp.]
MKVLQIAYYFPPMGGAGVQRALKFSKYLPEFGVTPVVLAAHDPDYVSDPSLAAEVPAGLAVHRVAHRVLLQRLVQWRRRRAARGRRGAEQGVAALATGAAASSWLDGARDAMLRGYAALQFPDDKAAWARRAIDEARRILREQRIDLIFSSSPPVSAHALGARLSRESGIPWVADYRDLWTEISSQGAPAWRCALDRRTESAWLRQAAGVVTVSPSWQRMLAHRVSPHCPVAFIPNGYDEADFVALRGAEPEGERTDFVLAHTGTFYGPRDPGGLLDGVALYLTQTARPTRRLRIRLIGNMGGRFDARLRQFDALFPGVVERVPYLPHRDALAELVRADALLLVVGGWRGAGGAGLLPGKIFEYLRAGKPILVLGDERGDAAELVRQHAQGWVVDEGRPAEVARALAQMVGDGPRISSGLQRPRSPDEIRGTVARFERRELARQLADFLHRCKVQAHG